MRRLRAVLGVLAYLLGVALFIAGLTWAFLKGERY